MMWRVRVESVAARGGAVRRESCARSDSSVPSVGWNDRTDLGWSVRSAALIGHRSHRSELSHRPSLPCAGGVRACR
eukprot:775352-Rhodomonas_salina.1